MEMTSPIFAALGVVEFDALNELACWLDGGVEPAGSAGSGRPGFFDDQAARTAGPSAGGEG